jgi:hypothetical protein
MNRRQRNVAILVLVPKYLVGIGGDADTENCVTAEHNIENGRSLQLG